MLDIGNLIKSISKEALNNKEMQEFIKQVESRLINMEKEKIYTLDRFEGDFAVCEDRQTRQMINIKKDKLPDGVEEGSVLKYKNGKFELDKEKQEEIEDRIKKKMDNLWIN